MRWIGQHIWDLTSRFRNDVYLEGLAETEETRGLVVDADGKVSINPLSGDEHATHVYENVRNDEGATIPVGTPVYSKGEVGGSERIKVGIAKASDPAKMPAIGITNTELTTTGDTKDGLITLVGVYNTNLSGFSGVSENDIVYVDIGGGLTITKPTGANLIQNVGIVLKTNGPGTIIQGLQVTCIGRTNDVPTPLYIDHTNQRLGIGTTSPSQKLDVVGSIAADTFVSIQGVDTGNPSAGTDELRVSGYGVLGRRNSGVYLSNEASGPLYFGTGGRHAVSTRMTIDSSGNVGIGTTSPAQKLHVVGDARIQGNLTVNGTYTQIDTDVNTTEQWLVTNDGTGPAAVINQIGTEDILDVQDDGTSVFYIEDGGNVGIGTTSPTARLEVKSSSSDTIPFQVTSSSDTDAIFSILQDGGGDGRARIYNSGGALTINLDSSGNSYFTGGNVGIGTTSPSAKLHVDGSATFTENVGITGTGNLTVRNTSGAGSGIIFLDTTWQAGIEHNSGKLHFRTGGQTDRMTIHSSGNVGIGTASPSEKLTIEQTSAGSDVYPLQLSNVSTTDSTGVGIIFNVSSNTAYPNARILVERTDNDATGEMSFWTISGNSGTIGERMRIDKDGNVGIGTSSPSEILHLESTAPKIKLSNSQAPTGYFTTLEQNYSYNGPSFAINSVSGATTRTLLGRYANNVSILPTGTGNVGIGTSSPTNKLDVAGNLSATSIRIGSSASGEGVIRYNAGSGNGVGIVTGSLNSSSIGLFVDHSSNNRNVGIGTTSPSSKLHVAGEITTDGNLTINSTYPRIFLTDSNHNDDWSIINNDGKFGIYNDTDTSYALTIDGSNKVGIGTTSPSSTLNINGGTGGLSTGLTFGDGDTGIWESADDVLRFSTVSSTRVLIDAAGNVGIGTTSPSQILHVYKGGNAGVLIEGTNISSLKLKDPSSNGNIGTYNDGTLRIGAQANAGTSHLVISSSGNVGIGTATSSEKLEVNGNIKVGDGDRIKFGNGDDLQIYHDGSNSYIDDTGTGDLRVRTTNGAAVKIQYGAENMIQANANSSVDLYYDNSKKLETTSTGVEVTGDIAVSGSVQRQISTSTHTINFGAAGSSTQNYFLPFVQQAEQAAPNNTHRMVVPYDGIIKKVIVHSKVAFGSSATVRYHRIDNGNTTDFANDGSTDDVTTDVSIDMSTAYAAGVFNFTTGNTFSAGDQIALSFIRGNTALGDVVVTVVYEYELF